MTFLFKRAVTLAGEYNVSFQDAGEVLHGAPTSLAVEVEDLSASINNLESQIDTFGSEIQALDSSVRLGASRAAANDENAP